MTARKGARKQPDITDIRGAYRAGTPACGCGFVGYPSDTATPYVDCPGKPGDQSRHQRQPVRTGATP